MGDAIWSSGYLFGKEPNAFLSAQAALLRGRATALAIADGEGRNGVWLAEQGLEVLLWIFPRLPSPKARARAGNAA